MNNIESNSADQNTTVEIERTYLAKCLPPELNNVQGYEMLDVYYPTDLQQHPRVRLRQKGNHFEITKKVPLSASDSSIHRETTIPLTEQEFEGLIEGSSRRLKKRRFEVEIAGRPAEVDVFSGELSGLVLIDFEFRSLGELNLFAPPDCCLADVTQENFIAGGLLAGRSYKDIKESLDRYGYIKIKPDR